MSVVSDQEALQKGSIQEGSLYEANLYKWIQSEKLGYDLGETAIREWYQKYWRIYCRVKRLDHVIGRECLQEFEDGPSEIILDLLKSNDLLLQLILDRVSQGWENFDVINWAIDWNLPTVQVREILEELNINCARFDPVIISGETG